MKTNSSLRESIGKSVAGVRRVHYVYREEIQQDVGGPLELTFTDGTTVVCDVGGDGETLAVANRAWVDPFAEPLSAENRAYVESYGKWTAFEGSGLLDCAVGEQIVKVDELSNTHGTIVAARIHIAVLTILVWVECDELYVQVY
ncbi:MAG: hypothetical protein FWG47_04625 [Propionibacteriaceae bacterium]|nr:hypothetical protein [Propionibacteriaceae bacterium]